MYQWGIYQNKNHEWRKDGIMSYKILNKELKDNNIRSIYLFYGPERYLVKYYLNEIKNKTVEESLQAMNYLVLEGDGTTVEAIIEFCDCLPIMAERKLLVIKDFLKEKSSDISSKETEKLINYLSNLPNYVHIVFIEDISVNKKSSLYKFLDKNALVIEFEHLTKQQLVKWVEKILKENNKDIGYDAANYLIDVLEPDMHGIMNECLKLISFVGERKNVSIEDINKICKKSINYKVFEMVEDISKKNVRGALVKLNEILNLKEPEIKILGLIVWNIKILLRVKIALNENMPKNLIAQVAGVNYVSKYIEQSQKFTVEQLESALIKCSEADIEMKTKGLNNKIVLEKLIVQISA